MFAGNEVIWPWEAILNHVYGIFSQRFSGSSHTLLIVNVLLLDVWASLTAMLYPSSRVALRLRWNVYDISCMLFTWSQDFRLDLSSACAAPQTPRLLRVMRAKIFETSHSTLECLSDSGIQPEGTNRCKLRD